MSTGVLVPNPGQYLGMTVIYVKTLRILPGTIKCNVSIIYYYYYSLQLLLLILGSELGVVVRREA